MHALSTRLLTAYKTLLVPCPLQFFVDSHLHPALHISVLVKYSGSFCPVAVSHSQTPSRPHFVLLDDVTMKSGGDEAVWLF